VLFVTTRVLPTNLLREIPQNLKIFLIIVNNALRLSGSVSKM
jgi:hypothetical protein